MRGAVLAGLVIAAVVIAAAFGVLAIQRSYAPTCPQSAESSISLFVVQDATHEPLKGVQGSGSVSWICEVQESPPSYYVDCQQIGLFETNGSLVPVPLGSIIGNYSLTLSYNGYVYRPSFGVGAEEGVNVTISLPSLSITEASCAFGGGGCFRTLIQNSSTIES